MSKSVPTKQHLRQCLLFFFNLKKSATEAHRILMEVYPLHSPDIRLCQRWFARFKTGDFDLGDKERLGPAKRFGDDELKALLKENPCRTQEELAKILNVTQAAVSKRLKTMGMIQRKGFWMQKKMEPKFFDPNLSHISIANNNNVDCVRTIGISAKDLKIDKSNDEFVVPEQKYLQKFTVLPVFKDEIVIESSQNPPKRRKRAKKCEGLCD